jgi:hypothetical protein
MFLKVGSGQHVEGFLAASLEGIELSAACSPSLYFLDSRDEQNPVNLHQRKLGELLVEVFDLDCSLLPEGSGSVRLSLSIG